MNFRRPIVLPLFCAVIFGAWGVAAAQEATDKGQNKHYISLLAVGDLPPVLFKDTASGPVLIEQPVEDYPPPVLYVKNKEKKDGYDELSLGLNTPMSPIKHPGGKLMLLYENKETARAPEAQDTAKACYLKVALPDVLTDLTVILARNPSTKNWRTEPRVYTLKNDLATFPPDCVRVINLSSHPIKGQLEAGETFILNPSAGELSCKVMRVTAKQNVLPYQFAGNVKGQVVQLANTATSFYQGTRLNMVIYDGDRKDSSGALRLCQFTELPAETPVPAASGTTGP